MHLLELLWQRFVAATWRSASAYEFRWQRRLQLSRRSRTFMRSKYNRLNSSGTGRNQKAVAVEEINLRACRWRMKEECGQSLALGLRLSFDFRAAGRVADDVRTAFQRLSLEDLFFYVAFNPDSSLSAFSVKYGVLIDLPLLRKRNSRDGILSLGFNRQRVLRLAPRTPSSRGSQHAIRGSRQVTVYMLSTTGHFSHGSWPPSVATDAVLPRTADALLRAMRRLRRYQCRHKMASTLSKYR